jgi:hypothetical protein
MSKQLSEKQYLIQWQEYRDNIHRATPVDLTESTAQKIARIKHLEANPEKWYQYYFPNFYSSEPAPFHIQSSKRILSNSEWFEMRVWARELSKTGRTMMDVLFLSLTKKKRNWLYVSSTEDSAQRLLLPVKSNLEKNNRIINDYGVQESGNWSIGEFVTKKGVAFRAIGAGQSPRGTRNDEVRPDGIILDDIDTDEECRNSKRIDAKVNWVMEALYATRSISNGLLFIVNGNIIAKKSTVTELMKFADKVDIVNIRDKNGKSTWPAKNKEEAIDRVLSKMSYSAQQKEYFNNPVSQGKTFKDIYFDKCPPIHKCERVNVYADPATSNKDKSGSTKAVVIIGYLNFCFYVYKVWVDQMGTAKFVEALYDADEYLTRNKVDIKRIWIENNSFQDPFYEQVISPAIKQRAKSIGRYISISADTRKKPDKYYRIEGTLEPIHRRGELIFNKEEVENPHMQRFKEQWLSVDEDSKTMDGPDALEGGVHKIQNGTIQKETTWIVAPTNSRRH